MKKTIILILVLSLSRHSFSQESVFDNYNFNSGTYQLQGIYLQQHPAPNVADTISDFYINDTIYLNWCKSNWKLINIDDRYITSYTYRIDIIKNKQNVESFWINLIDNVIRTNKGVFEFDSKLLLDLREHLRPLGFSENKFSSIQKGRSSLDSIIKNDSIISYYCSWEDYEGTFSINRPYTEVDLSDEDVKLKIEKELSSQFPNEKFEVSYITSLDFKDYSARIFDIKSSKNLFLKYRKDKKEWKPYDPIVYLRIKK